MSTLVIRFFVMYVLLFPSFVSAETYTLAGGPNISDGFGADDDVTVYLNNTIIYLDNNVLSGPSTTITFAANPGDTLRVTAKDSYGACRAMSPLYLHRPSTGSYVVLDPVGVIGVCDGGGASQIPFYDKSFSIGFSPTKDHGNTPKSNSQAKGTDKSAPGFCPTPSSASSDPVELATGNYYDSLIIMEVAAAGAPLQLVLNYSSAGPVDGSVGFGWGHPFQFSLSEINTSIQVTWPDRHSSVYTRNMSGGYVNSAADAADVFVKNANGTYNLTDRRQRIYSFDAGGKLTSTIDRLGFTRSYSYLENGTLDKVTDALSGRFLQFGYDVHNRVISVASASAGSVALTYDETGDLVSVTDALGNTTSFTYDTKHRLLTKVNPLGAITVTNTYDAVTGRVISQDDGLPGTPLELFTYATDTVTGKPYVNYQNRAGGVTRQNFDSRLNLVSTVDSLGGIETHEYSPTGVRTSYKDPLNNQTSFTYDSSGYVLSRTNPLGNVARYTYDADHNITSSTDEAGKITKMTYGANRQLQSKTDPSGGVTTYTYNAKGLLASITEPTGGVTTNSYDAQGNLSGAVDPAGLTTGYTYDAAGRMLTRTDGTGAVWGWTYDAMGHVLSAVDPLGNITSYTYDALGRMITRTAPGSRVTSYGYDIHDNLISLQNPLGGTTTFAYDANDQLISITDALGRVTTLIRDAKGRVTSATDPLGNITSRRYNAADDVISKRDAQNNQTRFTYDNLRRLTAVIDPLNTYTAATYNAVSRVVSQTDAKGNSINFGYDALGQLVSASNALGGIAFQTFDKNGNRTTITDANGNVTTFTLDAANRITRIATSDGGKTDYTYNSQNMVVTATNGRGQATSYTYNAARQLVSLTDATGTISFTYDANDNLLTVSDAIGTSTYTYNLLNKITSYTDVYGNTISYGYDAVGNLTTLTYPGNKVVAYAYDAADRMVSVTDWSGHVTSYSYNANGNITLITRANGTRAAYSYDAKGQVTSISETTVGNASVYSIAISYGANGNILSQKTTPSIPPVTIPANTMTYGSDNRLAKVNGTAVTYDADGNMTTGPLNGVTTTYSYDARSRLTGAGGSSYVYDAQRNRVSATHAGVTTRYVVDPNTSLPRVLMETDAAGTPSVYYVYGLGLISREDADGTYQTYHYDLRGSTLKLIDGTGAVTDSYRYGPYGELAAVTGETDNPFCYNGRDGVMTDPNGLYYMRARYYLPEAKRFVSRDTLLGSVDQLLTLNRFAYVNSNPVSYVDPSGMKLNASQIGVVTATAGALLIDTVMLASTSTVVVPGVLIGVGVGLMAHGILQIALNQGWHPAQMYLDQLNNAAAAAGNFIVGAPSAAEVPPPIDPCSKESDSEKRERLRKEHTHYYAPGEAPEPGLIEFLKEWLRKNMENQIDPSLPHINLNGGPGRRG